MEAFLHRGDGLPFTTYFQSEAGQNFGVVLILILALNGCGGSQLPDSDSRNPSFMTIVISK